MRTALFWVITLYNNPEESSSRLFGGGRLKSLIQDGSWVYQCPISLVPADLFQNYTYLFTYAMEQFSSCEADWPAFCSNCKYSLPHASRLSLSWAKVSVQVRGFLHEHFLPWYVFTVRSCYHLAQPPRRRTTPCRLFATAYSIYPQLPSILEAVPPFAACGRAMPWWQGPTYHGFQNLCIIIIYYYFSSVHINPPLNQLNSFHMFVTHFCNIVMVWFVL